MYIFIEKRAVSLDVLSHSHVFVSKVDSKTVKADIMFCHLEAYGKMVVQPTYIHYTVCAHAFWPHQPTHLIHLLLSSVFYLS